jgi:hypothetical protein
MHANHKTITEARHKLGITLNWLLEPVCFLCEESGEWRHGLCKHCWQYLPYNLLCCRICALPLASKGLCGACQATSMAYDRIIAPTVYRHPIDQMLCSLKNAGRLQWARTAAGLIVDCVLQQNLDLPQVVAAGSDDAQVRSPARLQSVSVHCPLGGSAAENQSGLRCGP